jgi:hypothetical protein
MAEGKRKTIDAVSTRETPQVTDIVEEGVGITIFAVCSRSNRFRAVTNGDYELFMPLWVTP